MKKFSFQILSIYCVAYFSLLAVIDLQAQEKNQSQISKQNEEQDQDPDQTKNKNINKKKTVENFENKPWTKFYGIYPHNPNYFMPFAYNTKEKRGQKKYEAKFQLSLKKKFASNVIFHNLDLYLAYTQESYWQLWDSNRSNPFRESNYSPEIYFSFPSFTGALGHFDRWRIGAIHQSNGQGVGKSRSWNRVYLQALFSRDHFYGDLILWQRIPEDKKKNIGEAAGDDNPDLLHFMGYGEFKLSYFNQDHIVTLGLRNNFHFDGNNRGATWLEWSFPLKEQGPYFFTSLFYGYGESLIDYNQLSNRYGIGIMLSR